MNTANALSLPFDSLVEKARQCSRYARHLLQAEPALLEWLQANYATPCSHTEMQTLLQQAGIGLGDETAL